MTIGDERTTRVHTWDSSVEVIPGEWPPSWLDGWHERLAGPAAVTCGPAGHALVSQAMLSTTTVVVLDGNRLARDVSSETITALPGLDEVVALRPGVPSAGVAPGVTCLVELGRLRHVLSGQVLREVLAHLRSRRSGDQRLLDHQLVKGALADAAIGLRENEILLADPHPEPATLALLHSRVTEIDRTLLRIAGAHGFTAHGPGPTVHLSELLCNVYAGAEL